MSDRRVAVVAGCRTPFVRSGTAFRDLSAVDLGKACVRELLERTEVDPASVGAVVMGQVVPSVRAPNLAREVGLGAGLPKEVPAHTVNRACASASQAIADVAAEIRLRPPRRRDRRGSGVPVRRPDPAEPAPGACARRGPAGEVAGGAARGPREAAAARPGARVAGRRRAVDGSHDGPVRREDGQGERHLPRGAGPDRARLPPQRLGGDRGRPARRRRPAPSSCRLATSP